MTSLFSLMLFHLPAACRLSSALLEPMMKARESALLHKSYGRRPDWRCFMSSSITNRQKKRGGGFICFHSCAAVIKVFLSSLRKFFLPGTRKAGRDDFPPNWKTFFNAAHVRFPSPCFHTPCGVSRRKSVEIHKNVLILALHGCANREIVKKVVT